MMSGSSKNGGVHIKKIWNKRYLISINDGDYMDTLLGNNCVYCEDPEDKKCSITQNEGAEEIIDFCSLIPGVEVYKRLITKRPYLMYHYDIFHPMEINISRIEIIKLKIHYHEESRRNIEWVQNFLTADEFIEYCLDRGINVLGIK